MLGTEAMARMGELVVSAAAEDTLVGLGLGSCIGLALLDRSSGIAGLAHVILPESQGKGDAPAKFADTAVPELVSQLVALGANRARLEAVLVGGAQMFTFDGPASLEIGKRNAGAVRDALAAAGIAVTAEATGGSRGRTVRVFVGEGRVTSKEAGGAEEDLLQ